MRPASFFSTLRRPFTTMDLTRRVEYYKTASSDEVFTDRERSRVSRKLGMPEDFLRAYPISTMNLEFRGWKDIIRGGAVFH
ncbi:hypothetical protein N7475_003821, partial [Penicillium sp. IBT 31633x]